jgi:hypothetical protein
MNRIDAQKAYLERLKSARRREQRHLSDADFQVFIARFDKLIQRVETELRGLESASNPSIRTGSTDIAFATQGPTVWYYRINGVTDPFGLVNSRSLRYYSGPIVFDYLSSVIQTHVYQPPRIETAQIRSMNSNGQMHSSDIQRPMPCAHAA